MSDVLSKTYYMKFSDGSTWAVPVHVIAMNHAMSYAPEQDVIRYLHEETIPLFGDPNEIQDWAQNNMDWSDVEREAVKVFESKKLNFQKEWGECEVKVK